MDLQRLIDRIQPLDPDALRAAREHQDKLTKPRGSLGLLEDVSVQLAGLAGRTPPPAPSPAAVAVFVGDHGVHAQGVTPWPQEVTAQMVANFLAGGAVVNAIAGQVGAQVVVVDVGMATPTTGLNGLVDRKVRPGTADMTLGPAMTRDEVEQAIEVGANVAYELIDAGHRCLLTGDMGVANTTASAALVAGLTAASPAEVTGHGAGIDTGTYVRKVAVIRHALELHRPNPADPIGALAAVGGLEHAALVGFLLAAAGARIPVLLDGVIACSAALVAHALAPNVRGALVAGHVSVEPGAARALDALQLEPLLRMRMRLGEGSGAALALPVLQAAVAVLAQVATFDGAGVTDKH